jgi:hypothetical protein
VHPNERVRLDHFEEVRTELGLEDLELTASANPKLVDWLSGAPHREAQAYSDRWMALSRHQADVFAVLRYERLRWRARLAQLEALHLSVTLRLGEAGNWSMSDHEPD